MAQLETHVRKKPSLSWTQWICRRLLASPLEYRSGWKTGTLVLMWKTRSGQKLWVHEDDPHYISEWVCKFMENIRFLFWTSHEEGSSLCRAGGPKGMRSCLPSKSNFILLYCLTCCQWKVTQFCTENEGDKSHRTHQVGKIRDQESSIPLCLSSYTGSIFSLLHLDRCIHNYICLHLYIPIWFSLCPPSSLKMCTTTTCKVFQQCVYTFFIFICIYSH
jgi:hypothetical protein